MRVWWGVVGTDGAIVISIPLREYIEEKQLRLET